MRADYFLILSERSVQRVRATVLKEKRKIVAQKSKL
jgi:hypothetical protein